MLDTIDVVARLGEDDAPPVTAPLVDVLLPRVVRGKGCSLVAVPVEQMAEVPGAVANVDLGRVQILDAEPAATCVNRDALGCVREQLHQPDRARARLGVGAELALL